MIPVRLLQFTDPHLYGDERECLRGVATLPALRRAIAHAQAHHWNADALLVTGDLVQDDPGGYATFRSVFGALGKPVLCLPGNHDDLPAMRAALDEAPYDTRDFVDFGPWRVVLLDSVIPGAAGGRLSADALERFARALEGAAARHALVCLHHHPVAMSSRWLDKVGLENAAEFFNVVDAHHNVRAVLWGHVHQEFDALRGNVRLLATPSTCAQFLPRSNDFAIDVRPPAYRTLTLGADGTVDTHLVWVDA